MSSKKLMTVLLIAGMPLVAACDDDESVTGPDGDGISASETMVLRLRGTGTAFTQELTQPGPGGETEAACFTVDLFNAATGERVGTATDCLSEITPVGDGMALIGTTIFNFDSGDSFTAQGRTSVQPKTHGSDDMTHVTGAIPSPGENGVIAGSGIFDGFRATVRLSGAVNLSQLDSQGRITFDCLFVVEPL